MLRNKCETCDDTGVISSHDEVGGSGVTNSFCPDCNPRGLPCKWYKQFPANPEQAKDWQPFVLNYPLHMNCLVAATTRIEGVWSAYCAPVDGWSHKEEQDSVLQHGDKLTEKVALAMFPQFTGLTYAR